MDSNSNQANSGQGAGYSLDYIKQLGAQLGQAQDYGNYYQPYPYYTYPAGPCKACGYCKCCGHVHPMPIHQAPYHVTALNGLGQAMSNSAQGGL